MAIATAETNGINLDELQREVEKLIGLLKDRQPGMISWHEFMQERLTNLHKLTVKALGKQMKNDQIDDLNREVTSAIRFAEELEEVKSEYTPAAWARVSFAEHYLANQLEFGTNEWKIAWRGAVRAAVKSGNVERAKNLIEHLKVSLQVSRKFSGELEALIP